MSRVNHPDTLVTLLREIQRRLRVLEGTRHTAAAFAAAAAPAPVLAFQPARPQDWPGTTATDWTPLVRLLTRPGAFVVVLEAVADSGGEVRVVVDGEVTETVAVTGDVGRHEIAVTANAELVVAARRTGATGSVRVTAFALAG
ncbi:hypothetical protein [Amycolatopsis sp. SID8362]|uniref:hypothetical protein n=1 Tax=Amycolatopsis sp. SID8362 TaxID=2690346 RepID=UPI001371B227|nr:hypothetical protein [Amycolatopsis sp. SID8362]NBH07688.1 hypothetical protein [Amycolatopsis sp. SID8362]NED44384.1 hypothetical protein [Amycolatopsis sp. SID8362]